MNMCIKFIRKSLLTSTLILGTLFSAYSQERAVLFSTSSEPFPMNVQKDLSRGVRLKISKPEITRIWNEEPVSFQVTLPMPGSESKTLVFHKRKIVTDDFTVVTSDGKTLSGKEYTGVHYQVKSENGHENMGTMSFEKNKLMCVFSDDYGNWNLGELPEGKGDYVLYCDRDLQVQSGFHCETEDGNEPMPAPLPKYNKSIQTTGTCRTVKIYFECDFKMYTDNASSTVNTSNKVTGFFNSVAQLYRNEQVDVEISQIFVWTTLDPFAVSTSSNLYLLNFATARQTFNGTLAHLLSTRTTSFGGVAYVNVLCNTAARFAYSNIYNTYSALPTYSWTIGCVAHELGHNFSSKHTHWCGWQLTSSTIGRIDSCFAGENVTGAVNCSNTTKANINGTIMSYCHLNGAINFKKGFGLLPGNALRSGFANATCITGSPVPVYSINGTRAVCEGGTINLNTVTSVTGATFNWTGPNGYTSSLQNPVISTATTNLTGDYLCTVSKSNCTSDPKTVNIIVNQTAGPPVAEGFESTFPSSNWRVVNPNNDVTWAAHSGQGGFGTSTKCIRIDNFNFPSPAGKRDTLFMPVLNMTGLSSASFSFDVAYGWNGVYNDTLAVIVSSNCGRSFTRLYAKTRNVLATAPNATAAFVPTSTQWRKETIDLSAYNGMSGVQVAFVNISGWSNFIYLDNINLSATGSGGPSIALGSLTQSGFCPGASMSVGFTPSGSFNTGNAFTVQMSNASGSFATPTTIGTGTASPISATIPAGTATGSGYLIRIVSSNPAVNSGTSGSLSVSPLVVSAGTNQSTCSNGTAVTLTGTPTGGTWSGSGVTSGGVFTPTTALVGTQTLTYSVSQAGCSGTGTKTMTVNAPPTVNAGTNQSTCASSAAFTLTGFSPAGGTWSGSGVSGAGLFTPTVSLIGNQILTYTATSNGCSASGTRTVTVAATISVSAGANQTVCSNDAALTLSGSPAGGTWSGSGVTTAGLFTPSSSLVGNRVLTYTVIGTCGGNSQTTITVNAAPTVNAGIDQSFCSSDSPYTIGQGSPSGGTWTGTGVTGGVFTPSASTLGSNSLIYTVTQNGCTNSGQVDFTVNLTPTPTVDSDQGACAGGSSMTLNAVPPGGSWSGAGVNASGLVVPTSLIIGTNPLTYTLVQNGCSGSASLNFTVFPAPSADAGADQSATTNSSDVTLTGSPTGGIWSGTAVSPSGIFSPATAGPGTFTLTYSVSANGCTGSGTMIFTVAPGAVVTAGSNFNICESAAPINLTGSPAGGIWSGNGVTSGGLFTPTNGLLGAQTLTYTVSGEGSANVVVTVLSTPSANAGSNQSVCSTTSNFTLTGATPSGGSWSGTGISTSGLVTVSQLSTSGSTFTYSVTQNGCSATSTVVITSVVPPAPYAGTNQNICKNAAPLQLFATPVGGTWTGSGVTVSGLFDPSLVSSGAKTLTYSVTGSLAGCNGSDQVVISVFNLPSVSAGIDRSTCVSSAPFLVSGTPAGGTWVGVGVSGIGLFTPTSGLAGVQTISYTVTQNGCSNTATTNITVNTLPVVSAGTNQNICTNSTSFNLSGESPSGGTWSGASFVNASGQCTPPFALGNYNLTYTVTQNGCSGSNQVAVSVNAVPTVTAGSNRSVCSNATSFSLTGFSPAGGIWSGNGVSASGVFTPVQSLVGNQTLTYSVVQNGCVGSKNMTVTVKAIPAIVTGANETACESGISFKINGYTPRGGKWTGPGIFQDSLFAPSPSLVGTQTLTYTITKNGCTNSAQKAVTVSTGNAITVGAFPAEICSNSLPVNFVGFLPAGGTWSGAGMAQNGLFTPAPGIVGIQSYSYKLNLNGCRDSIQVQTNVKPIPVVSAGPNISICASGSPVPLTNATPAGGVWSGSGVNDSGIFTPTSVPAGLIPLTYSYTENGCTNTSTMTVNVQSAPTVTAGNDKNICKNSIPVTFTGAPFGGTWVGTGVSSAGVFTPTASMSGNIILTYSINENGCSGTDQVIVSITTAVAVNAGPNQTLCDNENPVTMVGFTPTGGAWTGSGISASGVFTPGSNVLGSQVVTYKVTKNGCTVEASKTVSINQAPVVASGIDESFCSNADPIQLSGFSPSGGTWTGNGVNASGLFTPDPTTSGLISLNYTATANGCSASAIKIVTIIASPVVEAGSDATGCGTNDPILMSGYFPSGGSWSGNHISAAGVYTPQAGISGSDTLIYTLTQNGCTDTDKKVIYVVDIPAHVQIVTSAPSTSSCEGQTIPLNINISNPELYNIQWIRDGNNITGAITPDLVANQSGIYSAKLTVSTCATITDSTTLTFSPIPGMPTITTNGFVLTSSVATGNQWRKNGQDISGANAQTYTVTESGIYSVTVTSNSCTSDPSLGKPVTVTEVEDLLGSTVFDVQFFPNPNEGRFTLEMEGLKTKSIQINLLDALGKLVWTETLSPDAELKVSQEMSLPKMPAGMYWLQVPGQGKPMLKKMIIR